MDEAGILPDALNNACRDHAPKALYLIPTIQNPTTATMPLSRREEVAEILRANDVLLLEDDAYGLLDPMAVPLAVLVPERTYFASSLSKCIAPGLRVSFLLTPDQESAGLVAAVGCFFPATRTSTRRQIRSSPQSTRNLAPVVVDLRAPRRRNEFNGTT
jgi:DNA-binding transcriptional MocR family regulator